MTTDLVVRAMATAEAAMLELAGNPPVKHIAEVLFTENSETGGKMGGSRRVRS
jgi:hypothetical protein